MLKVCGKFVTIEEFKEWLATQKAIRQEFGELLENDNDNNNNI